MKINSMVFNINTHVESAPLPSRNKMAICSVHMVKARDDRIAGCDSQPHREIRSTWKG